MVNWKVRIKSPVFWIGLIGAIGTCVSAFAPVFGYQVDVGQYTDAFSGLITSVFTVLALFGVVADPTTKGITDSARALSYTKPANNAINTVVAELESTQDGVSAESVSADPAEGGNANHAGA